MTYKEIFDRKLANEGEGLFAELWSRPADCKPYEPEMLACCDRRGYLEYRVKVYCKERKQHWMDSLAMLIGYRFNIPFRCIRYVPFIETAFYRKADNAYSSAISILLWRKKSAFKWSSPEECEFKMTAAGLL